MAKVTNEQIHALAEKLGAPLYRKRYRMWMGVWHLGNTALVFDVTVPGGGYRIANSNEYPIFCDIKYIEDAVVGRASSLGAMDIHGFGMTYKYWWEILGKRAPGFFLGKVGDDIPGA